MSISNLFIDNNYTIYCAKLDTENIELDGVNFDGNTIVKKQPSETFVADNLIVSDAVNNEVKDVNISAANGNLNIPSDDPNNKGYFINAQPLLYRDGTAAKYKVEVDICKANDSNLVKSIQPSVADQDISVDLAGLSKFQIKNVNDQDFVINQAADNVFPVKLSSDVSDNALFVGMTGDYSDAVLPCIWPANKNGNISKNLQICPDTSKLFLGDVTAANANLIDAKLYSNNAINILKATNQLILGAGGTNYTVINCPVAGAPRTYTIPDAGGAADFVMRVGGSISVNGITSIGANDGITIDANGTGLISFNTVVDKGIVMTQTDNNAMCLQINGPSGNRSLSFGRTTQFSVGNELQTTIQAQDAVGVLPQYLAIQPQGGKLLIGSTSEALADLVTSKVYTDGAINIGVSTNQLVLGAGNTNYTVINCPVAGAVRTYTIPDAGADTDFVMSSGTQTISGPKTFTSEIIQRKAGSNYIHIGSGSLNEILFGISSSPTAIRQVLLQDQSGTVAYLNQRIINFNQIADFDTTSGAYVKVSNFLYPGANNVTNSLTNLFVMYSAPGGFLCSVRLYDITNSLVIAEAASFTSGGNNIILTISSFANIPVNAAMFELQAKVDTAANITIHGASLQM